MGTDTGTPRTGWRLQLRWIVRAAGYVALYLLAQRLIPPAMDRWAQPLVAILTVAGLIAAIVWFVRDLRKDQRAYRTLRSGGQWPLGEPYTVEVDARGDGARRWCILVLEGEGQDVHVSVTVQPGEFSIAEFVDDKLRIPVADVTTIRVRATWIQIDSPSARVRIVPRSYADRERLLFELAVHCNEAMERGIDLEAAEAKTVAAAPSRLDAFERAKAAAGGADEPQLPHLGGVVTGLGSALAGPMDAGNRPPPRKSGLGVGLFPGAGADDRATS